MMNAPVENDDKLGWQDETLAWGAVTYLSEKNHVLHRLPFLLFFR